MEINKIIILGHSGFIGQHLTKAVEDRIDCIGYSYPQHDLTKQKDLKEIISNTDQNTCIVMLAAIKRDVEESFSAFSTNMQMTSSLCDIIRNKPGKLIYISSATVYGEDLNDLKITEDTRLSPITYYGMAKFAAEKILQLETKKANTPLTIFRPSIVYGPGNEAERYRPTGFIRNAEKDKKITMWGEGEEKRDLIYVADACEYIYRAATSDITGIFNLASGNAIPFKEVIDKVNSLYGNTLTIEIRERTKPKVDQGFDIMNLEKQYPGIKKTNLETGIKLTYEHITGK